MGFGAAVVACGYDAGGGVKAHLLETAAWFALWAAAIGVYLLLAAAHAAPPAGTDPNSPVARWYRSLTEPSTGYGCCSVSDCRVVNARTVGTHWEVFIDKATFGDTAPDAWVAVADDAVLPPQPNPEGEPVACWHGGEVHCLVRASGT